MIGVHQEKPAMNQHTYYIRVTHKSSLPTLSRAGITTHQIGFREFHYHHGYFRAKRLSLWAIIHALYSVEDAESRVINALVGFHHKWIFTGQRPLRTISQSMGT